MVNRPAKTSRCYRRQAKAAGRDAVLAARFHGRPMAPCPFAPKSKRALYWHFGVEQTQRLVNQIEAVG